MRKRSNKTDEINTGSMADIAFLLLVFFLVATTMQEDYGITSTLSKAFENVDSVNIVQSVLTVNRQGELMVNNEEVTLEQLSIKLSTEFLREIHTKNVIVVRTERDVAFSNFIATLDKSKQSFKIYYESLAQEIYNQTYESLSNGDKEMLRKQHPVALAEDILQL